MSNSQESLTLAVELHYSAFLGVADIGDEIEPAGLEESRVLIFEDPPSLQYDPNEVDEGNVARLIRKFDPAARDMRNRSLGRRGEELVFYWERDRLMRNNSSLANKVRWISNDEDDGAGFDILSFNVDGSERLLEVKTTIGDSSTPFYISRNELELSKERTEAFKLIRLFDFSKSPRAYELSAPLDLHVKLEPINFIAKFR